MSGEPSSSRERAAGHLLRALEELALASVEGLGALREAIEKDDVRGSLQDGLGWIRSALEGALPREPEVLIEILEQQVARFEALARDDVAARRVRDLFQAVLDVVAPEPRTAGKDTHRARTPTNRRPPEGRRSSVR